MRRTKRLIGSGSTDRRAFLATMGASVAGSQLGLAATPSFAGSESAPIIALFRQWTAIRDKVNTCDLDSATEDELYDRLYGIERRIYALPSQTAADLAAKFEVYTDCNNFEPGDQFGDECAALVRQAVDL